MSSSSASTWKRSLQPMDNDIDTGFTQSSQDGLVRLFVATHGERRILVDDPLECGAELVLVRFGGGHDGYG